MENFFFYFVLLVMWRWEGGKPVINVKNLQPGAIATWVGKQCSVILLYSVLAAPSLIYLIVPNVRLGWIIDRFPKLCVG